MEPPSTYEEEAWRKPYSVSTSIFFILTYLTSDVGEYVSRETVQFAPDVCIQMSDCKPQSFLLLREVHFGADIYYVPLPSHR
jgi:hypothetical protein